MSKTNIEEIKATILRPLSLALRAVVETGDRPEDAEKCLTRCAEIIAENYTPKDQVQAECEDAYNRGYEDGMREEHANAMRYIEELREEQREHE